MLRDKDIAAVIDAVKRRIDEWHIAPLPGPRGADLPLLLAALAENGIPDRQIHRHTDVTTAMLRRGNWQPKPIESSSLDRSSRWRKFRGLSFQWQQPRPISTNRNAPTSCGAAPIAGCWGRVCCC